MADSSEMFGLCVIHIRRNKLTTCARTLEGILRISDRTEQTVKAIRRFKITSLIHSENVV